MKIKNKTPLIAFGIWILAVIFFWGLAFIPSGDANSEWLKQARSVCFGMLENGLPDAAGFMILILGPLLFLFAILIVWSEELIPTLKTFLNKKIGQALALVLLLVILVEGSWAVQRIRYGLQVNNISFVNTNKDEFPENYPRTQINAPDFDLINQYGKHISISSLKGKTLILTFAFAHCQTVCPTIVRQSINALEEINDPNVELLIITLDPWRDTPRALPSLAEKWELPERAHILSENIEVVNKVIGLYKIPQKRNEQNGDITHPALTYIIDREGVIAYTFNNVPTSWVIEGTKALKRVAKN